MKLAWTKFSGIRPRYDSRLLPDGNAQVASNILTERGGVRAIQGTQDILALSKVGVKTIYRYGQALNSTTQYWFHWTTDVDAVKGPIANDTEERTYWTGEGVPKYTFASIGTGGGNLPAASRPLGVPSPTASPTLAYYEIAPSDATGVDTREYAYTFVTDKGEESAPSPPAVIGIQTGQGVTLSALETAASNAAVLTYKRIYRAQRGKYLFVAEIPIATTTYTDTIASDALGVVCPSIGWDTPPATMFGLVGGPNGILAAAAGYDAMFCEPYRPHAWPQKYSRALDYPIVGVGQYGQTWVFLTTGFPTSITGAHPANMSQSSSKSFYQPCSSKRSIVSIGTDVLWASPDGLCSLGAGGERVLTADIFTPEDWRTLKPDTMLGAWHEGFYIGFYNPGAGVRGFMFNPVTLEWFDLPSLAATAVYRDTVADALYVCVADHIHKWRGGANLTYTWRSAEVVTPLSDYTVARVTGDYPITFKLYKNGVLKQTKSVATDEPFKLVAGLARSWSVEVSGANAAVGIVLSTTEADI
jgi:hypothetical protein